jgi:hypothetical protein
MVGVDPTPTPSERQDGAASPAPPDSRVRRTAAVTGAVVGNALPVVGILFLHWSLLPVVVYYLLGSAVAGVFALAKIVRCEVVSDAWRPAVPGGPPLPGMPSRGRILYRTGGVVVIDAVLLLALSDVARRTEGAWLVVALAVLVGQGVVDYVRRFLGERRHVTTTCAEVEVDFLVTFALFLGMVAVMGALGALGLADRPAATLAVLLLIVVRGAADVWRTLGRDLRHLAVLRDYAEHLAAVDAGVEGGLDE